MERVTWGDHIRPTKKLSCTRSVKEKDKLDRGRPGWREERRWLLYDFRSTIESRPTIFFRSVGVCDRR